MSWFDCGLTFSHFYLLTSNLLPNFLISVTHSFFNIVSSMIALNQIDWSELWKKVGFKPSEKVLVALRGVYNLPFNLDDPVYTYVLRVKANADQVLTTPPKVSRHPKKWWRNMWTAHKIVGPFNYWMQNLIVEVKFANIYIGSIFWASKSLIIIIYTRE